MKNRKIATKICLLSGLIILAFSLTLCWAYSRMKDNLYRDKEEGVQQVVQSAWGVIDHYAQLAQKGEMPLAQAQQEAKEALRHMRFGDDGYFWINDLTPTMVMHPMKPALEGKDLSGIRDPNGKTIFVAFAKVAKAKGAGFVNYEWPKPGFSKPVPKVSFVKLVPQWGWVVGAGVYLNDIAAQLSQIFYWMMGVGAAVILLSLLLVFWVARGISRPMAKVVEMLEEMALGHLGKRLRMDRGDEIGMLAAAMDHFAEDLETETVGALQKLAEGDLTFTVQPKDDQDEIRHALKKVGEELHALMIRVHESSEQIASGAGQIADASQSLSQGATEQASSLEEMTSSMAEIGGQTSRNAESATQANHLSTQTKAAAENGSRQMQQMVGAMAEIKDAGQSIFKIIKVIDEIAFQTNLLALNAAVEAARAGQHGKGFAVVAEEVRNLAGRSAKAARETTELIEGSVRKTENGAAIADETAAALDEIVAEVSKVSDLVAEIAASSNEQAEGLSQVNQGLEQIEQVTQQNTANAEETAAAAEELSSQGEHLRRLLGRFRLKGQAAAGGESLPTKPRAARIAHVPQKHAEIPWPERGVVSAGEVPRIALDDEDFGRY